MPVLQLLFLLATLALLGEAVRRSLSYFTTFTRHLDSLQTLLLDVYLGGGLLYGVFLLPFHIYTSLTVRLLLILALAYLALLAGLRLGRPGGLPSLRWPRSLAEWSSPATAVAVAGLFLLLLWVLLLPTRSFIYGSIFDTSLHALFAQVIQENHGLPQTLAPYEPTGIVFPLGAHTLFAYASYILGWSTPTAVFKVTPLFLALIVLGGYSLGKSLQGRGLGLALAFAMGFVASHPAYITWGANPTAAAYPLVLMALSLVPWLTGSGSKRKADFVATGLLLGYLAAINYTAYIVVMGSATLWWAYEARRRGNLRSDAMPYLALIGISLLPWLNFVVRFLTWYSYPGHNIGLPADATLVPPARPISGFGWIYQQLSPYPFLKYFTLALIAWGLGSLLLARTPGRWRTLYLATSVFILTNILIALRMLFEANIGASVNSFAFISLAMMVAMAFYRAGADVARWHRARVIAIVLVTILIASPFVYYRVAKDPRLLAGNYGLYAVASKDDQEVILWAKSNLSQDATVLVNPFEPGILFPDLAQRRAVFAYTMSQSSASYKSLAQDLKSGDLLPATYETMKAFGVTHLYLGSRASFWWTGDKKWPPGPFLYNPNFRLLKRAGQAYLFAVTYQKPQSIFQGDLLEPEDWTPHVPDNLRDSGAASLQVTNASPTSTLLLRAQKLAGSSYWGSFYVPILLGKALNPKLYLSLDASQGFGLNDGLMLILSSPDWKQQLSFVTPGAPPRGKSVTLIQDTKLHTFDLSQLWQEVHGTTLPSSLFLQVASYDSDGVPNVGYFNTLTIEWGE